MTSDSRPTTIEELAPLALTFDDVLLPGQDDDEGFPQHFHCDSARQRGDGHRHRDPDGGCYGA